ncbi:MULTISPECIES: polyphosphate--glucose phosphotransferase [unclassified Corynebacterium]|uniref:polyphosphate--glucose phosphotransferase n=1 Tax=unclassified Corynebacterium TaxID=2624378 RepID=UPI003524C7C4
MTNIGFGIDVGGSGIKGARVNLDTGEFIDERIKIPTPRPATPAAVAATVAEVVQLSNWDGPVGVTLPSVIRSQRALTAANIDPSWIDTDVKDVFHRTLGQRMVSVLNDADAAGLAEVAFGHPEARTGSVILLTFGTGIGSAFLMDGNLFPNTELGHLFLEGTEAEHLASSAVKEREDLRYGEWARERVSPVLREFERLFWPSLFIIGGGISRKAHKWIPKLECSTRVVPAELRNRAGIVGAAMAVDRGLTP